MSLSSAPSPIDRTVPRGVVLAVRGAGALGLGVEVGLIALTAFSALAFGAVHPWAHVVLWLGCAALGVFLAIRARLVLFLRRQLGARRVTFDHARRVIVLDPGAPAGALDLGAPVQPRAPLLLPGVTFTVLVCVQLLPWPTVETRLTMDAGATLRGLAFLLSFLVLHLAAAVVFTSRLARERYRTALAALGTLLGLVALVQASVGGLRIYGLFAPEDGGGGIFGPFVNRNSFAGYMLMVVPVCLHRFVRSMSSGAGAGAGMGSRLQRRLRSLSADVGARAVLATIPVLVTVAALIATHSRGALLALLVAFLLAGLFSTGQRRRWTWAVPLPFVALVLAWLGPEVLHARLARAAEDSPGRIAIWTDALSRLDGRWLTGTGFNTFTAAMSRVPAWKLPRGATPWPPGIDTGPGARPGFRALAELRWLTWHREAHNDWVQVLVETGVTGLAVALWAAVSVLLGVRSRPWLFIAMCGVLLHCFVDFDLQIPAVALLFVTLCGMAPGKRSVATLDPFSRPLPGQPRPGDSG